MRNPWLIVFILGIDLFSGYTNTRISAIPLEFDNVGHGTQYRFQYFVRDESGDYKTQEEAGEGGSARGSYAVEEPDGDLRIVQYNTDLDGSFKAHIKVDHAGKSPSTLQEIDIPAEEMKSLVNKMQKKKGEAPKDEPEPGGEKKSKSYVLGPPKKMSEIIMEQAAAIREIISKEIEAEQKREAEEQRLKNQTNVRIQKEIKSDDEDETSKEVEEPESPVVRVALSPKTSEGENPVPNDAKPKAEGIEEAAGLPVKNISFKNRLTFYKSLEEDEKREKNATQKILPVVKTDGDLESGSKDEIILYSPNQEK